MRVVVSSLMHSSKLWCLSFLLSGWLLHNVSAGDEGLVLLKTVPDYSADAREAKTVSEYLAKKADIDACFQWQPNEKPLASLAEIIAKAKAATIKPEEDNAHKYTEGELRGIDVKMVDASLWSFQVYFAFNIDRTQKGAEHVYDGEILRKSIVLPNGGLVTVKHRPITHKERIDFGFDTEKSSDPLINHER